MEVYEKSLKVMNELFVRDYQFAFPRIRHVFVPTDNFGHSPGHNDINVNKKLIAEIRQAFEEIKEKGLLKHGGGLHEYGSFKIKL